MEKIENLQQSLRDMDESDGHCDSQPKKFQIKGLQIHMFFFSLSTNSKLFHSLTMAHHQKKILIA